MLKINGIIVEIQLKLRPVEKRKMTPFPINRIGLVVTLIVHTPLALMRIGKITFGNLRCRVIVSTGVPNTADID